MGRKHGAGKRSRPTLRNDGIADGNGEKYVDRCWNNHWKSGCTDVCEFCESRRTDSGRICQPITGRAKGDYRICRDPCSCGSCDMDSRNVDDKIQSDCGWRKNIWHCIKRCKSDRSRSCFRSRIIREGYCISSISNWHSGSGYCCYRGRNSLSLEDKRRF